MRKKLTKQRNFSRLLVGGLLSLAVLGCTLGISSNQASAKKEFKGLLIAPASNRVELGNGQQERDKMSVQNSTDATMHIKMSVGSYTIENDNYNSPNYDSASKYSVMKNWIKLDKKEFDLAPGASQVVNYTIDTPANPPSGMQYATIFASTESKVKEGQSGIGAVSRVGMVVAALMKDGKTTVDTTIKDINIPWYQPGSKVKSSFSVKNAGNVGSDVTYSAKIKNALNGSEVFKTKDATDSVFPESTRRMSVEWPNARIGFYNVELKVKLDGKERTIKKMVCTIPVWIFILIIVAIACLIAYVVINVRISRDGKSGKSSKSSKRSSSHKK